MNRYADWMVRAGQLGRPTAAHFELTYRCNLTCRHCFQEKDQARDGMSLEDWLRAVDEARLAGVLVITLSGGEALLHPHFWTIARHIRARGMTFRLFTNGMLLNRRNCERLAELRPAAVEISVFSVKTQVHDEITGARGSLRKALYGLVRLRRRGVHVKLKCPMLDTSSADFRLMRRLAERFGAGLLFDPFISPKFNGDQSTTQCRGDDEILYEFFEDEASRKPQLRNPRPRAPTDGICGVAKRFTTVRPDGEVIPCPRMQVTVGNVKHAGLHDIFTNAPLLVKLRNTKWGDLQGCGTCERSGYCGRCSATAMLEDGEMLGPSSRSCQVAELKEKAWGVSPPANVVRGNARLRVLA